MKKANDVYETQSQKWWFVYTKLKHIHKISEHTYAYIRVFDKPQCMDCVL